ncbi:MAG: hypothetical protein ACRDKX_09350 [Solirubrobacterales bacterium]
MVVSTAIDDLLTEGLALEERNRELRLKAAVIEEAVGRRIFDPVATYALVDRSILIFDAGGEPLNALEAVDAVLEGRPWLAGKRPDAPPRNDRPLRGFDEMTGRLRSRGLT